MILDLLENKFTLFYPVQGVLNSVEYLVNDSLNTTKYWQHDRLSRTVTRGAKISILRNKTNK